MCLPLTSKLSDQAGLVVCVEMILRPFFTLALSKQKEKRNQIIIRFVCAHLPFPFFTPRVTRDLRRSDFITGKNLAWGVYTPLY